MQLGTERLQVDLSSLNSRRLDQIVSLSGKTKIAIINDLISNANLSDFDSENSYSVIIFYYEIICSTSPTASFLAKIG
jgi:hypothetical protein